MKHGYREPPDPEDFSLSYIKDFISDIFYGEYFPERIPQQDDEEELKQLEIMRQAIDKRIKEIQKE